METPSHDIDKARWRRTQQKKKRWDNHDRKHGGDGQEPDANKLQKKGTRMTKNDLETSRQSTTTARWRKKVAKKTQTLQITYRR
jgi:hypothetical protein